jgi:hypothetical protein
MDRPRLGNSAAVKAWRAKGREPSDAYSVVAPETPPWIAACSCSPDSRPSAASPPARPSPRSPRRRTARPTAYIAGEEASGAFIGGLRYGKGLLYMKGRPAMRVYWQGPSVGFDFGGNGSRSFTLCYNLQYPDAIFRRFPGVDGSAYLIGGLGVNYQRADDITLAPIRAGVGLRLGANLGYLSYSRQRNIIPF